MSGQNAAQLKELWAREMRCLSGVADERILLSPVLGKTYTQQELTDQLRVHMNDSGFSISDDEAMSLLISFSLYDEVCFCARTAADAQLFATVLLESFGLQSVSATVRPGASVELVSLLPEDGLRTPTAAIQPIGTNALTVYGHKTLFVMEESAVPEVDGLLPYPVIHVPAMLKRGFGRAAEWETVKPAALRSFAEIRADAHPMLSEAEKWFGDLKRAFMQEELAMPDAMAVSMRRFIEVASRRVRGGFLAAADTAACHWVVPLLTIRKCDASKLAEVLSGLPHTLDMLGIR